MTRGVISRMQGWFSIQKLINIFTISNWRGKAWNHFSRCRTSISASIQDKGSQHVRNRRNILNSTRNMGTADHYHQTSRGKVDVFLRSGTKLLFNLLKSLPQPHTKLTRATRDNKTQTQRRSLQQTGNDKVSPPTRKYKGQRAWHQHGPLATPETPKRTTKNS